MPQTTTRLCVQGKWHLYLHLTTNGNAFVVAKKYIIIQSPTDWTNLSIERTFLGFLRKKLFFTGKYFVPIKNELVIISA